MLAFGPERPECLPWSLPNIGKLIGEMYSIPQYVFLYVTLLGSMLTGASIVHAVFKPDMRLFPDRPVEKAKSAADPAAQPPPAVQAATELK